MRAIVLAFALSCAAAGYGAAADIDVEAKVCQKQMETLIRPDVDCTIDLKPGPDVLTGIPETLRALTPGLACRIPVKFRKAQVYGEWIGDSQARLPDFPVTCTVSAGGQSDQFTTQFRIECMRMDAAWTCSPILHDTRGLGILARPLENYVNNNEAFRSALTKIIVGN
jgi:hypothetical protein